MEMLPKVVVFEAANSFLDVAEMAFEKISNNANYTYSFCVNASLALELYIKSYLAKNQDTPLYDFADENGDVITINQRAWKVDVHVHKLDNLYQKIDSSIKSELEALFLRNQLSSQYKTLLDALTKYSNVFVESRYYYEKNGLKAVCVSDLLEIARFFKMAIKNLGEYRLI